jgi:2-aminoethylphosphonate-pyruvate transaminase
MKPTAYDLPLFTPGPLTTSRTVKQAMLKDLGSRDSEFIAIIARIRSELLAIGGVSKADGWTCIPMQGSGTFGIEAVISTAVPRDGSLMLAVNGAYGKRMVQMAKRYGIQVTAVEFSEEEIVTPERITAAIAQGPKPSLLAVVHCETTTGLVNPIGPIAAAAHDAGVPCFIDSMSGFGALPVELRDSPGSHWLVSSSNKCVEGVPGLSFVLARSSTLASCEGRARTLSLDLYDQCKALDGDGQFRFTPPTHVILALNQAISELIEEGGPKARLARYASIQQIIVPGLRALGLQTLLPDAMLSPIITSFRYPNTPGFDFTAFANGLRDAGYVIYPGKVSNAPCFRVGSIGKLTAADARGLVHAIGTYLGK